MDKVLKEGDKVVFKESWEIFPFAIIKKGETGTITHVGNDINTPEPPNSVCVHVRLDSFYRDLDEWDNEAHLGIDERLIEDYIEEVK